MDSLFDLQPHYAWLAIGLVLAVAEMAIPGVFLIWMAGAALITGLLSWFVPIPLPLQIVMFAVLSIIAVFTGRRFLRDHPVVSADPKMNQRGERVVGEMVVVTQAIEGGSGRVRLGDSEWLAKGADAVPGTRLRVAGHDGVVLMVEPVA
ncbi:NfeD family protein [Novosphingobium album (ex Liu et al. 2023)]|uniref:NfeD family protein n=1 Tax=Novosphingobium album (ex Liu et al. 2023) TaxID=3031130 RepID=A0ABT5WVN3_9SPHN|nr:NfeD family protein [Novosphingobium album (ex Liu et al. 2023)]MDE8653960.1 NfeD family protein [Novosphingobium album (ex Liu et al. 2023)]